MICTTACGFGQTAYDAKGEAITWKYESANETAFDIFSIDRVNKEILAVRVGAGINRSFAIEKEVYEPEHNLIWVRGTTDANGAWSGGDYRLTIRKDVGTFTANVWENKASNIPAVYVDAALYLAEIPAGSTMMTIPEHDSNLYIAPGLHSADGKRIYDPGYGVKEIDLTAYPTAVYYSANAKWGSSGGSAFSVDASDANGYERYQAAAAITDFIFT